MLLVDLKPLTGSDGTALSGDMAVRVLDLAGIVCNRQTIPGDTSALRPSGFRLGTPWVTQRGAGTAEIDELADIIADVVLGCQPFSYTGRHNARAKIDFDLLQDAKNRVRDLTLHLGIDTDADAAGYPHFFYSDEDYSSGWQTFAVHGDNAEAFLDVALTADVLALDAGQSQPTHLLEADGSLMASGHVEKVDSEMYHLHTPDNPGRVAAWLRSLSDGFVVIDPDDIYAKVPGPVVVRYIGETEKTLSKPDEREGVAQKAYFIGMNRMTIDKASLPVFEYDPPQHDDLRQSVLYDVHQSLGARMGAFAGYDMPLWYDSVQSEHLAVRNGAGIFDVTHMGTLDVKGSGAEAFLNAVTTNNVKSLSVGQSHYTFLLDVNGVPFDDLLIYRLADDHFFVVVNASNNDKNWAWLNAVKNGEVRIDNAMSQRRVTSLPFELRDLRDDSAGADRRVDIALQGPESREILCQLEASDADKAAIRSLSWSQIAQVTLEGRDVLLSRTGYTGERIAYELFPHPDDAAMFFEKLTALGAVPCGLAARDSLRIEAGLPLYGHELGGDLTLNPADAGMGSYVKLYKPFFAGKQAFIAHEISRNAEISRFRMTGGRARPAHQGDPIVDERGRVVGVVTSCSIDSNGNQLGQAYLKTDYRKSGTELAVFAGSARLRERDVSQANLGDRTNVPQPIVILRRFPKR
jgi:glycine hydroxymethyltransferase